MAIIPYGQHKIRVDNLYSLSRVSSSEQGISGEGLERQMRRSREFAEQHKIPIDQEFVVTASGSKGHHIRKGRKIAPLGVFLEAAEDRKLKPYPALAVESWSRLGRMRTLRAVDLFRQIIDNDCALVTLTSNRWYNREIIDSESGAMHTVVAEIQSARTEAENKSDYSKFGNLKRRGKQTAIRPAWIGATRLPDDENGHRRYKHYVLPGAEDILLRIFQEVEYLSVDQVAARLNADGIPVFERWNRKR